MSQQIKINWYRCKIDPELLSALAKPNDAKAWAQVLAQLGLYVLTGTLAFLAFERFHADSLVRSLSLVFLAMFVHGTCGSFMGTGGPVHELCHRTPFKKRFWNDFFVRVYAFLSWINPVGFRASHIKHHQFTVHHDHDGEVVLPKTLDLYSLRFVFGQIVVDPVRVFKKVMDFSYSACGIIRDEWLRTVLSNSSTLRTEHKSWARIVLGGHLALAILFVLSGHWCLILIVTFGAYFSSWLTMLCGEPQHLGMAPDVPDFRLCCRTYTCGVFPAFLYWNMQYHVEHHMFPAVPFYNLPRLHAAIRRDLPPVTHGLWATWREIIPILNRQRADPTYFYIPDLHHAQAGHVGMG